MFYRLPDNISTGCIIWETIFTDIVEGGIDNGISYHIRFSAALHLAEH